jgi:hypothetical protein
MRRRWSVDVESISRIFYVMAIHSRVIANTICYIPHCSNFILRCAIGPLHRFAIFADQGSADAVALRRATV